MQGDNESTATLPGPGEVLIGLPQGGIATGKKLDKADFAPGGFEKYQRYIKDKHLPENTVLYLDFNDRSTQPGIREGYVIGQGDSNVLLINAAEFQASPEFFRKLELPQAKLDALVAARTLTDAEHGSREDKRHYEEFREALAAVGADPNTKLYINRDKDPGIHMPISSSITREGKPYVIAYEKDIKHWNAAQLEGMLGHDAVHVRDGDITPERQAAMFNDKSFTLARESESHADAVAAERLGHPEAMAQALQIGLDLQLKAYRKEMHKGDAEYLRDMSHIDPFHDPIKDRIDKLKAMATPAPAKQR